MRRFFPVAVLALAFVPAAAGGTMNPCVLINSSDATAALGTKASKGKASVAEGFHVCTYTAGRRKLTVEVRAMASKASFDKAAKKVLGPTFQLPGIGDDAYSAGAGQTLLVWKKGVEITFTFFGTSPVVQTQKDLANAAIARL